MAKMNFGKLNKMKKMVRNGHLGPEKKKSRKKATKDQKSYLKHLGVKFKARLSKRAADQLIKRALKLIKGT